MRNYPADRYSRKLIQQRQHSFKDRPTHILEIDINPVWTGILQLVSKVGVFMINTGIKPEFVDDKSALFSGTCNTDSASAFNLRDLPDSRPNRPGGRRNYHGLPRLGLSDIQ